MGIGGTTMLEDALSGGLNPAQLAQEGSEGDFSLSVALAAGTGALTAPDAEGKHWNDLDLQIFY